MARATKAKSARQPMVAEAAVEYEAKSSASLAEVFWIALKGLPEEAQGAFIRKLLDDPEWYEELADAIAAIEARGEPSRAYDEFEAELRREGRL